ncbi:MAG: hypothetical protein JWQ70_2301 [Aeromicrobium sp.]|nr:hypothetical protein [Aeromicrobium sp.]
MPARRASFTALALVLAVGTGAIVAAGPASAAGPFFVATTGVDTNNCTAIATPCKTVQGALAKATFVSGDTINVAAGTYTGATIFSTKGANVVGTGAIFDANNVAATSVMAVTGAVTVKLTNVTLRNGTNNSTFGGGLRVQTAGAVVTGTNVTISGNKSALGGGAAVYAGTTLNLTDSTISGNSGATTGGGAIYNAGTTSLTNVAVTGNSGTNGAGLYNAPGGTLTATNGSISGNTASSVGGGMYVGATTTLTGVNVHDNTALYGGGVAVGNAATLNVNNGAISNNSVTAAAQLQGWGGGVYVAGKTASAATGVLNIDGTTLNSNFAAGGANAGAGLGGAILTLGTTSIKGASFSGNRVTGTGLLGGYGGAIYHGANAPAVPTLTISDTTIAGGGVTNATAGGAIAAVSAFDATRLTVSGNTATVGGGIYTTANMTLTDSSVKDNKAPSASASVGGGIAAARPTTTTTSTLTLDNTDVTGNTSGVYGGGLALGFGVTTEIRNGSKVDSNVALDGAGAFNSGALTVRDSSVSSNDAAFQGGGVYNGSVTATDTPSLTLNNAAIDDNTAASGGGGLLTIKGATLTSTDGHVNGNSAIGGGGLAVGDGAPASFDGTDFIGNTASNLGGGAILSSGDLSISHATLRDNTAAHTTGTTGLAAAIYSGSGTDNAATTLKVRSSLISGNQAYAAAAILTYSTGTGATNKSSIDNTTITGNTNTSAVGSIEQFHPMTITNSTITGNTAASGGSGAFFLSAPTQVGIAGTIISGNSGNECTAAVTDGGRNLTDSGDTSCGFTPAKNDLAAAPQLGILADNGGPTKSLLPGPASPALDKVPATTATGLTDAISGTAVTLCASGAKDQRDIARPQGAKCDIGAVEAQQIVPVVSGPASADYTLNSDGAPVTFTTTGSPQAALTETGDLPAGVTFHDNGDGTATLSGHPTAGPGGVYTITVKATNEAGSDTKSFDLRLHQAPKLTGPMASTYTVGQAGGPDQFSQTEGFPDAILSSSTLPGGLAFTPQSGGKGTIAGTPDAGTGGHYDVTITGDNGTPPPATWPFSLTINQAPGIDGPAASTFTVGTAGSSDAFTTTGYPKPDLSATGLPNGLSVSGNGTAKITGTPANGTGGEYDAVVKASNGIGSPATKNVHVTVKEAPELVGPSDARMVAGVAGEVVFSTDGYPVADLTATGSLPAGVTFVDHHNGTATLGGTPTAGAVGHYNITVTASNGIAPDSVIHLSLDVVPHVAITSTTLPDAPYKTAYSAPINIVGGLPSFTFSLVSGSLPAGLTLNANGTITGSATGPVGTSTFKVKVTDGESPAVSDTKQLTIKVVKGATAITVSPVVLNGTSWPGQLGIHVTVGVVTAKLTGGVPALPLAGQTVVFKTRKGVPASVCTAQTDATGTATCKLTLFGNLLVTVANGVEADYAGNAVWLPSTGSNLLIGPSN